MIIVTVKVEQFLLNYKVEIIQIQLTLDKKNSYHKF